MKYKFEVKPQGTRMDGANLFGLTVTDTEMAAVGSLSWMAVTQYDELTQPELMEMMVHLGVRK